MAYYDSTGHRDWVHANSGAPVLKAQHPEFEMYNQGIHARSGVACADCHMPYDQEAARVLGHALDEARKGQAALAGLSAGPAVEAPAGVRAVGAQPRTGPGAEGAGRTGGTPKR
jgi:formate-dependent nitrite reductase cytochrome c552 subunit